jgi:hypothetical protein
MKAMIISTGEIVEIYYRHKDGIAYVTDNGVRLAFHGEYTEI